MEAALAMKLAYKLTLAFLIGMSAVLALNAVFGLQREIALFETDMLHDHRVIGRALSGELSLVWSSEGEGRARERIRLANEKSEGLRIRWIWLDEPKSGVDGPSIENAALEPVAQEGELTWVEPGADGFGRLYTYFPVQTPGDRKGAIELSESLEGEREYVRATIVRTVVTTIAIAIVLTGLASMLGAWLIGRPVRALVDKARRVGSGDLSGPLDLAQRDEFGELAREMNAMCDRLVAAQTAKVAALDQLRRADRLATIGQFASGVAHEMGTPLNVIAGRAKMIRSGQAAGTEVEENARIVCEQAERMTRIIRQLLDFARPRAPKKAPADLGEVARRTLALLSPLAEKGRVTFALEAPEDAAMASVDAAQIEQVLMNLIVNGVHAMPRGGRLTLGIRRVRARPPAEPEKVEGEHFRLSVGDEGEGIPPEVQAHLFEPFFTTKEVGEGTGLGLSVAHGIVREHGGWIAFETTLGQGTCFSVFLPSEAR